MKHILVFSSILHVHACRNVATCGFKDDLIIEQQGAAAQPQHAVLKGPVWPLLQARSLCNEKGLGGQATQAVGPQGALVWNVVSSGKRPGQHCQRHVCRMRTFPGARALYTTAK